MKWEGNRESDNVEDRRGSGGGGGGGLLGGRGIGVGTIVIALVGGWIFGINPMTILGVLTGGEGGAPQAQVQQRQRRVLLQMTPRPGSLKRWWPTPKMYGKTCLPKAAPRTAIPNWCCFVVPLQPHAAKGKPPWARFTALPTSRFTSTWSFTRR